MITGSNIPNIAKGDEITADWLNKIVDAVIRSIYGGEGIHVTNVGNRIIISIRPENRQIVPH